LGRHLAKFGYALLLVVGVGVHNGLRWMTSTFRNVFVQEDLGRKGVETVVAYEFSAFMIGSAIDEAGHVFDPHVMKFAAVVGVMQQKQVYVMWAISFFAYVERTVTPVLCTAKNVDADVWI